MEMASIGRMLVGMGRFAAPCRFLRKDSSSLVGVLAGLTATVGLVAVAFSLLSSFFFFFKVRVLVADALSSCTFAARTGFFLFSSLSGVSSSQGAFTFPRD